MRLLHTSDWHVGRTFHGRDLLADQESVLDELVAAVGAHGVDVVLIAGDLYDRAVPAAEAVGVCERAMARLRAAGAELVLTSGNHDSAVRVGANAGFLAAGGLHVRTRIDQLDRPVELSDIHGAVRIYGLPYLEPDVAWRALQADERSHTAVLAAAMDRVRGDHQQRSAARSVVLGHAFVTGAEPTDSERSVAVGGVEQVPASVFEGMDYVALGHLHRPQVLRPWMRYSGSPLAYSFSEAGQRKRAWLVDIGAAGLEEVTEVPLRQPRRLATLTGELDHLLGDDELSCYADYFLSIVLTDAVRPVDPMRQLRQRFPHALHMEWQPPGGKRRIASYTAQTAGVSDKELVANFLRDCRGSEPAAAEAGLIDEAMAAAGRAETHRGELA